MRIKLINPPVEGMLSHMNMIYLPYGIAVLMAYLRDNGIPVDFEDLNARLRWVHSDFRLRKLFKEVHMFVRYQTWTTGCYTGISDERNNILAKRLTELINIDEYDVIGIRINSYRQALPAFLLAEKIKKDHKKPVIIGGPYVTLFAHLFFQKYNFIDYAIVGHGEIPLLKLIHYLNGKEKIQNVPSCWFRDNNKSCFNRRIFYNIEDQPCPDFDGFPLKYYKMYNKMWIPYSVSRGCVHKCSFCIYSNVDGEWQCKSTEKVIKDITALKEKYMTNWFFFEDTNFNISYQYVEALCDQLINSGLNICWIARAQPRNVDRKLINMMRKAGCWKLEWGIESGSDTVKESMKKGTTQYQQLEILKIAKEAGIKNCIYLMAAYPYETIEDLKETALLIKKYAYLIDEVLLYGLGLMYGSNLFNNPEVNKIKIKEVRHSYYSYMYGFEEVERKVSLKYKKKLKRMRKKVMDYNFRYIISKNSRFPFNIVLILLGFKFQKFICGLVPKIYFSEWLNKYSFVRNMMSSLGYTMRRFSFLKILKNF